MKVESEKIFPKQSDLIVEEDITYNCFNCGKDFPGKDMKSKKIPHNFHVFGLKDESEIPQCPLCDAVAFFGFNRK